MKKRAYQDINIWQQITDPKIEIVKTPRLTLKQLDFWEALSITYNLPPKKFSRTQKELFPYTFDKGACIAYSKGVESSYIRYMFPYLPTVNYNSLGDKFKWTDPIEPATWIAAAGMGYSTMFFGNEKLEGINFKYKNPDSYRVFLRQQMWYEYSGAWALSPTQLLTKYEIFKVLHRENVSFHSCFYNNKEWCGKCYKCLITDLMFKLEGAKSPIVMSKKDKDIFKECSEEEIGVYKKLLNDYRRYNNKR